MSISNADFSILENVGILVSLILELLLPDVSIFVKCTFQWCKGAAFLSL